MGCLVGAVPVSALPMSEPSMSMIESAPALSEMGSEQADQADSFVTRTMDEEGAAVVQINVSRSLGGGFGWFIPFFSPFSPGGGQQQGIGSGFVIDARGLILTNAHVVEQADQVMVGLADGRMMEGRVLGTDSVTDVAVIQVDAEDLPTVRLGDSDRVRQGQWAIAIGNPLGLQETVTVGVISATERYSQEIGIRDKQVGFLQTDAAINPGNSGGPLLNRQGEVIGMNTAIIGGTQGLGFAVPINTVKQIAQQLIETGQATHPYIGIQMATLTPAVRRRLNQQTPPERIQAEDGIVVMGVADNSPADRAGLKVGDVICSIGGEASSNAHDIQDQVRDAGVGGTVELRVQRQGRSLQIAIQPEELPAPG